MDDGGQSLKATGSPVARYGAFISYSHRDEEIADWLHKRLEGYRVPGDLVGRQTPRGQVAKRLGKVFRDRADLSAADDLASEIRSALERADALIVLCSPRSCGSKYVHEEIRYFKELGKGRSVYAAIVDGEPHAAGRPGFTPADECFPPALLHALGADNLISDRLEEREPIAADFRDGKDGRENGSLKIIAGLLDVELDDLVKRERRAERRRRIFALSIALGMSVLAALAIVAAIFAFGQSREAVKQRDAAHATLVRFFASQALEQHRGGNDTLSLRYALAGMRVAPANSEDYADALAMVAQDTGDSSAPLELGSPVSKATFSADGRRLLLMGEHDASVWDARTLRQISRIETRGGVTLFDGAIAPDGRRFVALGGGEAQVRDGDTGALLYKLNARDIYDVTFSPDGQRLATSGEDRAVRIWNARDGSLLATSAQGIDSGFFQDAFRRSTAFSPDGRLVITTAPHNAFVWDGRSATLVATTTVERVQPRNAIAHGDGGSSDYGNMTRARFSDDGAHFVTVRGQQAEIWTAGGGRRVAIMRGHTDHINDASFSTDGRRLVTSSDDGAAMIWDVATGRLLTTLTGHSDSVRAACFSPDGHFVVTAGRDGTAKQWNAETGELVATFRAHTREVTGVSYSPDGTSILTASLDGTARVWRARGARQIATLTGRRGVLRAPAFSADGRRIITNTYEEGVQIWDSASGRMLNGLSAQERGAYAVAISPDLRRVAIGDGLGAVRVLDVESQRVLYTKEFESIVDTLLFSPDSASLLVTPYTGDAEVYEAATGDKRFVLAGRHPFYAPDGQRIITTGAAGGARLLDAASGRLIQTMPNAAPSFSPDAARVVDVGRTSIRTWDRDGRLLSTLQRRGDEMENIIVAPDGQTFLSQSWQVTVSRIASGEEVTHFTLPGNPRQSRVIVRWAPDGQRIATTLGPIATIWDARTGARLRSGFTDGASISTIAFSADGRRLLTMSEARTAIVWSTTSGRRLGSFSVPVTQGSSSRAMFAPDGASVLIHGGGTDAVLWDVRNLVATTPELATRACNVLLGPKQRRFTHAEIAGDPLLTSEWSDAERDVCERVGSVTPLPPRTSEDSRADQN